MKRIIRTKYAMYTEIRMHMEENREIWTNNPAFVKSAERFNDLFNQLDSLMAELKNDTIPVTIRKHEQLELLTEKAIALQGILKSFAIEQKNESFQAQLSITLSDLKHGAVLNRLVNIRHLAGLAAEHLNDLSDFGWDNSSHDELSALIQKANAEINSPRKRRTELAVTRDKMDEIIKEIDKSLDAMDLMTTLFKENDPSFVENWVRSRELDSYRSSKTNEEQIPDDTGNNQMDDPPVTEGE